MSVIPPPTCPFCQSTLDRTVAISDNLAVGPQSGDWTVCSSCGGILLFTEAMTLRIASKEEMIELGPRKLYLILTFRDEILIRKAMRN